MGERTIHELKTCPMYFDAVLKGIKNFELRFEDDKVFMVGDILILREYDRGKMVYSGREIRKEVMYVLRGHEGLKRDYAVLGLK